MCYAIIFSCNLGIHDAWKSEEKRIIYFQPVSPNTPYDRNATHEFLTSMKRPNMGVEVHLDLADSQQYAELADNFITYQSGIQIQIQIQIHLFDNGKAWENSISKKI